jgi:hypothetical protein
MESGHGRLSWTLTPSRRIVSQDEEAEEGEEGEEAGEPKEPPPPPPAPKVDPYEFKERDVVYLDVSDLPAEVSPRGG